MIELNNSALTACHLELYRAPPKRLRRGEDGGAKAELGNTFNTINVSFSAILQKFYTGS